MIRRFVGLSLIVTALAVPAAASAEPDYPSKPVRIVIGFGPGSGTDIISRLLAEELRKAFSQPFIVENKPGAAAQIAASFVAKAPPDGYTLLLTSNTTHSTNPHLFKSLPYDPVKDFTPVGGVANFPFIVAVDSKLPVKTPEQLVQYVRAQGGKVNYAYGNSPGQIAGAALNKLMALNATAVPYKSSPEAMADVVGGQAAFMVVDVASSQAFVKAGRLRPLAVTTSVRSALVPDLPTIEETLALKDFDLSAWTGIFGPAGLPRSIVERLNNEVTKILNDPQIRARIQASGAEATPSTSEKFEAMVQRQLTVWGKKVQDAGIIPQ